MDRLDDDAPTAAPGPAATPPPAEPPPAAPVPDAAPAAVWSPPGAGLPLAVVALLWSAGMLWAARATILTGGAAEAEVTSTAYALPGAISAALVAGAGVALAVLARLDRPGRTTGPTARLGVATGTGLLLGLLAAASVLLTYPDGWLYAVVAGTMAAAGILGGAVAGIRKPAAVAAACWAGLAVFALGFTMNLFSGPLLRVFGSGDSLASRFAALDRFALAQAVLGGILAGLVAFGCLRRTARDVRWPFYAAAGAGPGLFLIIAEILARTAGGRVLDLAGRVSIVETAAQDLLAGSRLNSALIVIFVGAFTAMIAVGRTIKPAAGRSDSSASEQV